MWLELFSGRDSFRAQDGSAKRNVSVQPFVRVTDDGEGRNVVPLYQAFSKKLKGFGKSALISRMSATEHFGHNDCGEWFKSRYEVAPRTEILLEYRHRATSGFQEAVEHIILIADSNAPLYQIRIDLPPHALSAVPCAFFEGRFIVVDDDKHFTPTALAVWRKHLGVDDEYPLCYYLDPLQEEKHFNLVELEARIVAKTEIVTKETASGKPGLRIKRTRNIKVRNN